MMGRPGSSGSWWLPGSVDLDRGDLAAPTNPASVRLDIEDFRSGVCGCEADEGRRIVIFLSAQVLLLRNSSMT